MVLFVLITNFLVAFIQTGATASSGFGECEGNNTTDCGDQAQTNLFLAILSVSLTGLEDAPDFFNVLYVLIMNSILIVGIVLIAQSWTPLTS